jgi:malic enzyme
MVDDIQGTGAVTQAAVKSAVWAAKGNVAEQKIVIFGAGTAGTGTIFPYICNKKAEICRYCGSIARHDLFGREIQRRSYQANLVSVPVHG